MKRRAFLSLSAGLALKRRAFLSLSAGLALAPLATRAATVDYTPGLVTDALARGETVFLAFNTDWCPTCAAQSRVITALMDENPAYGAAITFVRVDWDKHKNSTLANSLNIPRRSTLVVLKGDKELGRIVAGTRKADIKALMDTALKARPTPGKPKARAGGGRAPAQVSTARSSVRVTKAPSVVPNSAIDAIPS